MLEFEDRAYDDATSNHGRGNAIGVSVSVSLCVRVSVSVIVSVCIMYNKYECQHISFRVMAIRDLIVFQYDFFPR